MERLNSVKQVVLLVPRINAQDALLDMFLMKMQIHAIHAVLDALIVTLHIQIFAQVVELGAI
jgi:hypothetical protein